jgi:hypothetical protein
MLMNIQDSKRSQSRNSEISQNRSMTFKTNKKFKKFEKSKLTRQKNSAEAADS